MEYRFDNLLGAPYRGGNLVILGNELLSCVGNRVSQVDLTQSTSCTLPFESLRQLRTICVSPDGTLLLAVDVDGRSLLINRRRRTLLHHFTFKHPVAAAKFSSNGKFIACAVGRLLQVWRTPGLVKAMSPMQLHRTYGQCHADVTSLDWSADSKWLAVGSKDLSARVFSLDPIEGYKPPLLAGHREEPIVVFWAGKEMRAAAQVTGQPPGDLFTVTHDGALFCWSYQQDSQPPPAEQQLPNGVHKTGAKRQREAQDGLPAKRQKVQAGASAGATLQLSHWPGVKQIPKYWDCCAAVTLHQPPAMIMPPQGAHQMEFQMVFISHPKSCHVKMQPLCSSAPAAGAGEAANDRQQAQTDSSAPAASASTGAAATSPAQAGTAEPAEAAAPAYDAAALTQVAAQTRTFAHGRWKLQAKHLFNQRGARVTCADLHKATGMLVVGFSNGIFDLFELPNLSISHSLSNLPALDVTLLVTLHLHKVSNVNAISTLRALHSIPGYCAHLPLQLLDLANSHTLITSLKLPEFSNIHTLSISRERISAITFNAAGDWIALGCAALGQLLVWEWRSETYVLKQQGHLYDVAATAFSPDGSYIATGADDAKVKLWNTQTGFCFVTFREHTAPVTAVAFLPSGSAVLSASLDGTVRAFDLVRYRNFRTMTSPTPMQFRSLALDPSGEVICAGCLDTFQICVWSVRTGRLLDILAGHEGPVCGLAFTPAQSLLASASWDKTARTWDVFSGKGGMEVLQHNHDVLAVAVRHDGKQLASSTLDGQIYFWDPLEGELQGTIEGRRDIAGGRLSSDRRAAGNANSGRAFTSLAYSADGSFLLAGGSSKFVCMYDTTERIMLRRFQISHNKSLDGVLDQLNSRNVTEAGPADLLDDAASDEDEGVLPTTGAGGPAGKQDLPGTGGKRRAIIRTRAVALAPTGRSFAAATTEGLLVYTLDQGLVFDPTDLAQDVMPEAAHAALAEGQALRAALIALRLRDGGLLRHALLSTPPEQVAAVANGIPSASVPAVLTALAEELGESPHLQFLLNWVEAIAVRHGSNLQKAPAATVMPALRALQRVLGRTHEDLAGASESNLYTLAYLCAAGKPSKQLTDRELAPAEVL